MEGFPAIRPASKITELHNKQSKFAVDVSLIRDVQLFHEYITKILYNDFPYDRNVSAQFLINTQIIVSADDLQKELNAKQYMKVANIFYSCRTTHLRFRLVGDV